MLSSFTKKKSMKIKKKLLKITLISIFNGFSSKIFKKCTVLGVHKSIDNEIITIFRKKFSYFHGFLKMLLYLVKLKGLDITHIYTYILHIYFFRKKISSINFFLVFYMLIFSIGWSSTFSRSGWAVAG